MKESGCQSLFIGFETINQDSLKSVRKRQNNVGLYEQLIREVHRGGIMINASLAFGFDHDSPTVFRETLSWLVEQKVETMTAHILTPYPGTILYRKLLEERRIIDFDWAHYNTSRVVFMPKHITPAELYQGYLWIYEQFYSMKNIVRRMPTNRKQWLPYLFFNFGYRKFGKATSTLAR